MPFPVVLAAAKAGVLSSQLKELKSMGEKILGKLTGCRVKPKGTPHDEVRKKLPKLWYQYGAVDASSNWIPGSPKENGATFETSSGAWLDSVATQNMIISGSDRDKLEATARKECETLTHDTSLFTEYRNPDQYRGIVRLKDGWLYDANLYGLQGGSMNSPVSYPNIDRKKIPEEISSTTGQTRENENKSIGAGFNPLALIALLPFVLGKK
ncbi:hypothetical protein [Flavobacterium sp.]|uniref:hypothetical protein n=1 Tax=Flavobacterium sp. TaxID=239 RepID=UPI002B4B08A3|nr:hypothetical protein [Flavobacterium sp.]HLF51509.1 hypothetical protein [Flavobacterium sp.]